MSIEPKKKLPFSQKRNYTLSKEIIFSGGVLGAVLIYGVLNFITRGRYINSYFVTDHTNTGMDYFNMLSNITQGNPYYANANYPALNFVVFKLLFHFSSSWFNEAMTDGFVLREDMTAQLVYIVFMFGCVLIIWEFLKKFSGEKGIESYLFAVAMVFSGPMLFLYERGNILIITLILLLVFLMLYDSDFLILRIVSYVCLACAAAMKLYPAVYGFLVLRKKRYKETAILAGIGLIAFVVPFFVPFPVFGGINGIRTMIHGFTVSADIQLGLGFGCNFSFDNLYKILAALFGIIVQSMPKVFLAIAILFCFVIFILSDSEWKQLYAMTLLALWTPAFSYTYSLVLLFLPIISFFYRGNQKEGKYDKIYTVLFGMMMVPYFLPYVGRVQNVLNLDYCKFPLSYGMLIINLAMVAVAVLIVVEAIQNKRSSKIKEEIVQNV